MDQFRSENDWPLDLEGIEVTPILDDSSPQMIDPEGGYGAVALGEPDTSPFGAWDSGPQQPPSFSRGIPQSSTAGCHAFEPAHTFPSVFGGSLDVSSGSLDLHPGANLLMPAAEFSSFAERKDEFQSPDIWGLETGPQSQFMTTDGLQVQSHSEIFPQTSSFGEYREQPQPRRAKGKAKTKKINASGIGGHAPVYETSSSLIQPHRESGSCFTESYDAGSSKLQRNFQNEPVGETSHSSAFRPPFESAQTSEQSYPLHPSYYEQQFPSTSSGYNEMPFTGELQQTMLPESFEGPRAQYEPTSASQAGFSASGVVYENIQGSASSSSGSDVGHSGVNPKQKQKKRSRLRNAEYQSMSLEQLYARQKELNRIAAKEYRERTKMALMKSQREYEEEQQRQQLIRDELAWIEAKIAALVESFRKLSAS